MMRVLQPELLDSLPPGDAEAGRNRRDLVRLNRLMGNFRWFERVLPPLLRPGEAALEVGAGLGELGLKLAARGLRSDGLDLWPRPARWPAERAWHQADLRRFEGYGAYPVVFGNLILHQFADEELARLGAGVAGARAIVACEPLRSRRIALLFRLCAPLLRLSRVSRHDGRVSIEAGFTGDELPRALGLRAPAWQIELSSTKLGAHRMVAIRCP